MKKSVFSSLLLSFLISFSALAQEGKSRWAPDDVMLQYAGSIGLFSAGFGYSFLNDQLEADLMAGYLPESVGGVKIFTTALKVNWLPLNYSAGRKTTIEPIMLGGMLAYAFGDEYFVSLPEKYKKGYYPFPTALHFYYRFGSRLTIPTENTFFRSVQPYYEVNADVQSTISYVQNATALSPADLFHLAVGVRFGF